MRLAELRSCIESMDEKGRLNLGQRIVARAWTDPQFKVHQGSTVTRNIERAFVDAFLYSRWGAIVNNNKYACILLYLDSTTREWYYSS